ncbi:hypothetical protein C0J52_05794 [Blattella germanica]|nr:hypothetical protein C0J52_05794 [Blattella germanica]
MVSEVRSRCNTLVKRFTVLERGKKNAMTYTMIGNANPKAKSDLALAFFFKATREAMQRGREARSDFALRVRQQSKDIANDIRQRVRGETVKQFNGFEKKQKTEQDKQRAQKIHDLQQQYQDCLEEIGMGHLQAALEPNPEAILEAEREWNRALAEERGKEAAAKLRQDLADAEERKSAARNQQKFARTVEDLRSAVIVSLTKKSPKRTPKKKKIKKRKPLSELSDNVPPTDESVPLVVPPPPPKAVDDVADKQQATTSAATSSSSSATKGTRHAPCTSRTAPEIEEETMGNVSDSDSVDNIRTTGHVSSVSSFSSPSSSPSRKSPPRVRPTKVRFYDHTNKHECEYDHCTLVERVVPNTSEADATEAAELESQRPCEATSGPPLYACTYARGQRALARERVHRDYKQLLGDLHNLAREERLIKCTRDFCLPPEVFYEDYRRKEMDDRRQRNMDSAFEKIYHGTLTDTSVRSSGASSVHDMHPQWQPSVLDSPATLNVADYQPLSPAPTLNVGTTAGQSSTTSSADQTAAVRNVNNYGGMASEPTVVDSGIRHSHRTHRFTNAMSERITPGEIARPPVSGSLEELMQRVNEQQAKLLEEMKMYSETPDTLQHIPELASSIGRTVEEMQHISDQEKKSSRSPENVQELSNDSDYKDYSETESPDVHGTVKSVKMTKSLTTCVSKKRGKTKKEIRKSRKDNSVCLAGDDSLNQSDGQAKEVLSEFSYERSVVESSIGSSVSASTSYEGMKIIVSMSSEFKEEMYRPGHSPRSKKTVSIRATPPRCHNRCKKKCKQRRKMPGPEKGYGIDKELEDKTSKKPSDKSPEKSEKGLHVKDAKSPSKRRHRTPEKLSTVPEREDHVEKDAKDRSPSKQRKQERGGAKEKATTTNISSELEDSKTNGERKWQEVFEKSMSSGKDTTESTSYMSPPEELISSNIKYLSSILSAIRDSQKSKDHQGKEFDPKLVHYISRLLSMSRESIENLGVSSSDISTPDVESSSLASNSRMNERRTNRSVQTTFLPDESSIGSVNNLDSLVHAVRQKTNIMSQKRTCTAPCSKSTRRIPGTSTPEENEADQQTVQNGSNNEGFSYEVETPPFSSRIADMSLDEYKAQKFPELFTDYSERCTRRISSLSKKIEEIRDEQRRLMNNLSGNSSSSTSSGKEGHDSTKYLSPPESSTVMTQVKRKDNVHPLESVSHPSQPSYTSVTKEGKEDIPSRRQGPSTSHDNVVPPQFPNQGLASAESLYFTPPGSATCIENAVGLGIAEPSQSSIQMDASQSQYYTPAVSCTEGLNILAESATGAKTSPQLHQTNQSKQRTMQAARDVCGPCAPTCNKMKCTCGKNISRETRPHTRPPSTLLRHNVQSSAEDKQVKELSTIIEGDSTFSSLGSNRERRRQSADQTSSSVTDDSVPDVLSEMYRRGLLMSPLNLPEIARNSSLTTSSSTPSSNEVSLVGSKNAQNNQQVGFLTYIGNKSEEISRMLTDKFKNLFKNDNFSLRVFEVFSMLGKNLSAFQVELALMLLGLIWDSTDKNVEVRPHFSSLNIDTTTETFQKQIQEAFKGLNEDSPLSELEVAFHKIGLICPGGVLRRLSSNKLDNVTPNSSDSTELSTSLGSALLPPIPTSISVSTEDLSTTQDERNAS